MSRILFLSDAGDDARTLGRMLQASGLSLEHVRSLKQAGEKLRRGEYEIVLTACGLPDGNWLDALHLARDCAPGAEVIVTDAHADARLWAEALNMGAYDVLAQPFYGPEVRRILSNACSRLAAV